VPDEHLIPQSVDTFANAVAALAASVGLNRDFTAEPLFGGANNRVFRLNTNHQRTLLKAYFRHPADTRDRLTAEFSFLRFAWNHGLRCIPEPLAFDAPNALGLYRFIDGRRPEPNEIRQSEIDLAAAFFVELNRHRYASDAASLSPASEACFSIEDHVHQVDRRVRRLQTETFTFSGNAHVVRFVRADLPEAWERTKVAVREQVDSLCLSYERRLTSDEKCLSPSDFGFHNALQLPDGGLCFVDFEYAGWDDPAKMICDFFCQPAVPAPQAWHGHFAKSVVAGFAAREELLQRVQILLPLYRIKWCCIVLNGLLPEGRARREFAGAATTISAEQQLRTLERANSLLQQATPAAAEHLNALLTP